MEGGSAGGARKQRDFLLSSSAAQSLTPDFENITINSHLMPQAASTVQRKQGRKTRPSYVYKNNDFSNFDEKSGEVSQNTSLGLLDINEIAGISELNYEDRKSSNIVNERKLARNLLEKCTKQSFEKIMDTSKMNLSQNRLYEKSDVSSLSKEGRNSFDFNNKSSNTSMNFEPSEILARSSEISNSLSPKSQTFGGISMSSSTAAAMAKYAAEDFHELNSKVAEQFEAERGFSFNNSAPPIPETSTFDELNMMSDHKLVEMSENASLVSFTDYCKKKCGNYDDSDWSNFDNLTRPSIGLGLAESPQKTGHARKLVNTTLSSTEKTAELDDDITNNTTVTDGANEIYHMNLASISRILNDKNTPRTVIDKLLELNKRASIARAKSNDLASNTYTFNRTNQMIADLQRPEKDTTVNSTKQSSDELQADKTLVTDFFDKKNDSSRSQTLSKGFSTPTVTKFSSVNVTSDPSKNSNASLPKFEDQTHTRMYKNSVSNSNLLKDVTDSGFEVNVSDLKESMNKAAKKIHDKENCLGHNGSMVPKSPRDKSYISVGTKSQEVTTCLVKVPTKAEIEVTNKSARWILVSAKLFQIQGDKDNIELRIPEDITLIKPSDSKSIKIGVTMMKLCKPIITSMQLEMTDMVTREKWNHSHLMCFISEENNIQISCPYEKDELIYGDVGEEGSKTLPITIANKNSIDVTVEMQIVQNKTPVFFINNPDDTLKGNVTSDGAHRVSLKSKESVTINVEFRGLNLATLKDLHQKSFAENLIPVCGRLLATVYIDGNVELMTKEIGLSGRIGTVKIEPCDTPAPLIVSQNQSKPLYLKNHGTIVALLKSSVVLNQNMSSSTLKNELDYNFMVAPEKILIKPGEKGCIFITYNPKNKDENERQSLIQVNSENGICTFPVVGVKNLNPPVHDNYNRCETPMNQRRTVSPSSPQSAISYGSLQSGRNSPGSSCGGSSVTGDAIPIRATHSALNWGSVRTGKRESKEFTIRNMSNHKLKLIATIEGSDRSFKFVKDAHGTVSMLAISLQSFETKTLVVVFEPHDTGACAGKIVFHYYAHKRGNVEGRPTKIIQLSGYCGYAKLDILETLRDMSGQSWLSLGNLNSDGYLEAKIRLKNYGDLACYAKLELLPKIVNPDVHLTWQLSPRECLLDPKEVQEISLFFKPKKKDLDMLKQSDSSYLGTLKIIHGDEPSRLRLRRLYTKMERSGEMDKRDDAFKGVVSSLCKVFPGEKTINDLVLMRDSMQNLPALCRGINEHEIKLTMEMDMDESESIMTDTLDDTATFHSLLNGSCNDVTLIG